MFHLISYGIKSIYSCTKSRFRPTFNVVILGIDNAGKTTLRKAISDEDSLSSSKPTMGYKSHDVPLSKMTLRLIDLGGNASIRQYWKRYYAEAHAVIYVVDSTDATRMQEAQDELQRILTHPDITEKPILIALNKQDLPGSTPLSSFAVPKYRQEQPLRAVATVALVHEDAGWRTGLKWLQTSLSIHRKRLFTQVSAAQKNVKPHHGGLTREERLDRLRQLRAAREAEKQREDEVVVAASETIHIVPGQLVESTAVD
eukprot:gnl/Dysnectes_brevis/3042_a3768_1130.p1 GENE.gnl/Dysnectes_brevis/3042_a3768_1130~~gnl/Dysnectes_brevis/3042_a3768_1130.p1  ORF type:complete len:257 (+),score=38.69 gnl/Dysnectes_brevis/3042_a3768_1130:119-889(+)